MAGTMQKIVSVLLSTGIPPETVSHLVGLIEGHAEDMVALAQGALIAGDSAGDPVDSAIENRRRWDRERKARKAALRKSVSTGIPPETSGNSTGNLHSLSSFLPSKSLQEVSEKEALECERARLRVKKYTQEFESLFWKPYPRTPVMSKKEAFEKWDRASPEDRSRIVAALPAYIAFLKANPEHPPIHAVRFISQRRFEGFEEAPQAEAQSAHPVGWRPGLPTREEILERERKAREARANDRGGDRGNSRPETAAVLRARAGLPEGAVGSGQGAPAGDHAKGNGHADPMDDLF